MFITIMMGLLLFAVGFFCGHLEGEKTARRHTEASVPLALRQRALLSGKCPTCDFDYSK